MTTQTAESLALELERIIRIDAPASADVIAALISFQDVWIDRCNTQAAEIERLRDLLSKAESSLSDYYAGAEWGKYDLKILNAARAALETGK
jgi:hypothetical protein